MKIVYMSDDGKVYEPVSKSDSCKKVQAYEEKQLNPLAKMDFPYSIDNGYYAGRASRGVAIDDELVALIAFANLAPKIKAWRALKNDPERIGWHPTALALIEAYDEAEELAKKL